MEITFSGWSFLKCLSLLVGQARTITTFPDAVY
jgi:hypothetical protein